MMHFFLVAPCLTRGPGLSSPDATRLLYRGFMTGSRIKCGTTTGRDAGQKLLHVTVPFRRRISAWERC